MFSTRIDFVAPPFAGHLFPLLDLAGQLRRQGFDRLRILSTPESRRAAELAGLPLVPLLEGRSHIIFQISDTPQKVGSNPFRMYEQLKLNLGLMQELQNQLRIEWTVNRPDLVVADFTVPIAGLLAQSTGIRWWTSMPSPCVFETGDGTPSYLGGWMPPVSAAGRLRDAAGRQAIRTFKNSFHWLLQAGKPSVPSRTVSTGCFAAGCENWGLSVSTAKILRKRFIQRTRFWHRDFASWSFLGPGRTTWCSLDR